MKQTDFKQQENDETRNRHYLNIKVQYFTNSRPNPNPHTSYATLTSPPSPDPLPCSSCITPLLSASREPGSSILRPSPSSAPPHFLHLSSFSPPFTNFPSFFMSYITYIIPNLSLFTCPLPTPRFRLSAVSSVHALVSPLLSALRDSGSSSHHIAATDSMGGKGALIGRIGAHSPLFTRYLLTVLFCALLLSFSLALSSCLPSPSPSYFLSLIPPLPFGFTLSSSASSLSVPPFSLVAFNALQRVASDLLGAPL